MLRPSRLSQLGFSEAEALRKQALADLVLQTFRGDSAGDPEHALWVPGRLEILGKHTDYGGGHSLVAPVPRGFALLARRRDDGVVALHDASRREQFAIATGSDGAPDEAPIDPGRPGAQREGGPDRRSAQRGGGLVLHSAKREGGWRRYALTTVRRIARNFPGAPLGADVVFASDLPPASGMSSSSALIVALAATLVRLGHLEAREEWQANIRDAADTAGYFACIENGLSFGSLAGDAGVGTHGGSEDHVAIVCGKAGQARAWTFVPVAHVADAGIPADWQFVIASSAVAARKTGEALPLYNNLALAVRALVEIWNAHEPALPSLRAIVTSAPDATERLRTLIAGDARARDFPDLAARLTQFVNEDARVVAAVRALHDGDGSAMDELSLASQQDAEQLLGNQTPETSALTQMARALGAFAASAFGAGFGGSVWALVGKQDASSFAARWLTDYRERFPGREAATSFEAPPGPPLTWVE